MAEPLPRFVARRRPEWEQLAALTQRPVRSLKLSELRTFDALLRRASADLAHAEAWYPDAEVVAYLHQLCATAFARAHPPPEGRLEALRGFFAEGLPRAVRELGGAVRLSALLLVSGILLGALIVSVDPRGAELLVPPAIRTHVAAGTLWTDTLLSVAPPGATAGGIASNNLTVTVVAFASGLLFGAGSALVLLTNGLLLGAVFALCIRRGLGLGLFDFVLAHGPLELSIIVLAAACGLTLGGALLDPGELPRREALSRKGRTAVRVVLGCAPFLALDAVVEGFVSPGHLFPSWVKAALGLSAAGLFWLYLLRAGLAAVASAGRRNTEPASVRER